jgi:hypothetical protein
VERSTSGKNVVNYEHARTRRNLEAATELSTYGATFTRNLFGEDAAHAKETTDLVGEQHTTSCWPSNKINLDRGSGGNGERTFGKKSTNLRGGVWVLQKRPLLKVAIAVSSALQEEMPALQRASRKEEPLNTARAHHLVVRTDRRLRITLGRLERISKWQERLTHGESLACG